MINVAIYLAPISYLLHIELKYLRLRAGNSELLLVPFCSGPAGRKLIYQVQFVGAVLWNNLPALARSEKCLTNFKAMISSLPLSTAPIV